MTNSKELLDELLKGVERPEDLLGDAGLMKELKIKLMERMLSAELTAHLGYEDGKEAPAGQANRRNGASTKVLKGQDGEMSVAVPRDRDSSFEPELVEKGQTLLRHESHAWLADRDGYRLRIVAIVLLPPPEWFDVLGCDDPDLVAQRLELSLPEEGAGAGFDPDQAGRNLTHGFE
ncbi:hypothetical protein LCGC14_2481780 [marine sediment metagenome]|uniref:Mutator family transposase n=1 Tax=marine sediment metagenome TaxID=412755 RepID=A0A0F9E141_9ZZZZ